MVSHMVTVPVPAWPKVMGGRGPSSSNCSNRHKIITEMTAIKGCPLDKKVRESSWRSDTRTEIGRLIKSKPGQEGKDGHSSQKEQHVLPPRREVEGIHGTDALVERGGAGKRRVSHTGQVHGKTFSSEQPEATELPKLGADMVRLALTSPGAAVWRRGYVEANREALAGPRRGEQGIGPGWHSRGAGKG